MELQFRTSSTNELNPFKNKKRLGDFFCHNDYYITHKNKPSYKNVNISFGIRRSKISWVFPINIKWNKFKKSVSLNFWKVYFTITNNS